MGVARLIGTDPHLDAWGSGALPRVAVVRRQVRLRRGWKQVTAMQQGTGSAMLALAATPRSLSFNRNRQDEDIVVSVQIQDDAKR